MNPLLKSVLSIPCPTCRAAAGQRCDMTIRPEWIAHGVRYPYHYARHVNRPIARDSSTQHMDWYRALPEEKRKERERKRLEAAKRKRRENNWRLA